MNILNELRDSLVKFDQKPESVGYDLRLSLADILVRRMKELAWSQKDLASAVGIQPSIIHKLVHAKTNCTFELAGKVLFALGIKGELCAERDVKAVSRNSVLTKSSYNREITTHGKEDYKEVTATKVAPAFSEQRKGDPEPGIAYAVGR